MKIVILSGSVRAERQSHKVAEYLKAQLNERNIEVDLIDFAQARLPIFSSPDIENNEHNVDQVENISRRLDEADAMIFVTPEYHGSFSGVLKNALDYFWSEFSKKPIAVAAASTGRMGGINASVQLQHVILSLGAYPLPLKFLVPDVQNAFDESLNFKNERTDKSAQKFLDEFLWFTNALVKEKQPQ